ncbi:zinc knuckle CX2CX4HX4C containing protein [Tanacetum coccineum]
MVSPSDPIVQSVDINTKSTSYAGVVGASAKDQPKVNSNFCPLVVDPVFDGDKISIPRKVVEKVSTHFEHTLYGCFIGKKMAFPVVKYYARNNWEKHRLKMIMMNNKGFFFFKFDSRAGLEAALESDPWLIFFEEDGISLIATFIEADFMDVVTIGIMSLIGEDFTKETIRVEYEWRPPRCDVCKMFGHVHDQCPKKVASPPIVSTSPIVTPTVEKTNDGFQMVGKKKKRKGNSLNKDNITSSNSFFALNVEEEDEEEEVENVYDETANLFTKTGESSFTSAAGHQSNNYSESKRNDHLDNNRRQEQRNKGSTIRWEIPGAKSGNRDKLEQKLWGANYHKKARFRDDSLLYNEGYLRIAWKRIWKSKGKEEYKEMEEAGKRRMKRIEKLVRFLDSHSQVDCGNSPHDDMRCLRQLLLLIKLSSVALHLQPPG